MLINVKWETDGEIVDDLPLQVDVPNELFGSDPAEENHQVCEYLSDNYGWLVYDWTTVEDAE